MSKAADRVNEVKRYGLKAKGRHELLQYLNGKALQSGEAILAKCYECMGYYADGKCDCGIKTCPLYARMPYRPT